MSDLGSTQAGRRQARQPAYITQVFGVGIGLLLCAAVLYVSGLSRAVGVVVAVLAVAAVLVAFVARRVRAWPSRRSLFAMAALLVALVAYGVWLLIDSAMHPPMPV